MMFCCDVMLLCAPSTCTTELIPIRSVSNRLIFITVSSVHVLFKRLVLECPSKKLILIHNTAIFFCESTVSSCNTGLSAEHFPLNYTVTFYFSYNHRIVCVQCRPVESAMRVFQVTDEHIF